MRIIDISRTLGEGLQVYPGDPEFKRYDLASFERDGYRLSRISMCSHAGTHIDAPSHYIEYGKRAADLDLRPYIGPASVVADEDELFSERDQGIRRFLLLFDLSPDALDWLLDRGVYLIGTGQMTIGDDDMHRRILYDNVALLENLELARVRPGRYTLIALPIKLNADGAPVRAVLIDDEV